jgi:hypothetical protein
MLERWKSNEVSPRIAPAGAYGDLQAMVKGRESRKSLENNLS